MHNDCPAEFVSFVIVVRFGSECVFCSARGGEITCQPAKWLLLVKSQWIEVALVCCPCDCFQIHLHVPPSWFPASVQLVILIRAWSHSSPSGSISLFHKAGLLNLSSLSPHSLNVCLHTWSGWYPFSSRLVSFHQSLSAYSTKRQAGLFDVFHQAFLLISSKFFCTFQQAGLLIHQSLHTSPGWPPQSVKLISSFHQSLSPHLIKLVSLFHRAHFICQS